MFLPTFSGRSRGVFNQYLAAMSGSLGYAIMGTSTAWPSPTLVEMKEHVAPLSLDISQESWMVSAMFLGYILSPVPSGIVMNWFGSRKTCLFLSGLPVTSWVLIYFATSPIQLYAARFAAGLWIGVITTVMPLYVGDISSPALRNSLTTINNLMLNFGVLFVYVVGPYVSYRALAVVCQAVTLLYVLAFSMMPESPYHLLREGRPDLAVKVMRWLRSGESEAEVETEVRRMETVMEQRTSKKATLSDIFCDRGNRRGFIISMTYSILKRTSGSGVMQAYTSITLPDRTFRTLDPDTCVIIIGLVSFVSSVASTFLSAKLDRRWLLTISCGGCGLTTFVVAVWFYLRANTGTPVAPYSDALFVSFALYYSVFSLGLGPVGTSIKGEVFTGNVKGLGSSIITLCTAVVAFFLNRYYLLIAKAFGMYVNYLLFSVSCVVAVAFTWLYVPDMHNKTLEEIHEILASKRPRGKSWPATS